MAQLNSPVAFCPQVFPFPCAILAFFLQPHMGSEPRSRTRLNTLTDLKNGTTRISQKNSTTTFLLLCLCFWLIVCDVHVCMSGSWGGFGMSKFKYANLLSHANKSHVSCFLPSISLDCFSIIRDICSSLTIDWYYCKNSNFNVMIVFEKY